jgi:hypothetical protein
MDIRGVGFEEIPVGAPHSPQNRWVRGTVAPQTAHEVVASFGNPETIGAGWNCALTAMSAAEKASAS